MEFRMEQNGLLRTGPAASRRKIDGYCIMHMNRQVACVWTNGRAAVYEERFMPYDLVLDSDDDDIDTRVNNLDVFYHWCASRVLSLDRKYAKEILNSIGASQATTDKERAKISLSYHCASLTDVYWVKKEDEEISFDSLNLYDHPLNDAIVELSLRGKQMTVTNHELAPDLSTHGCFAKAWIRTERGFRLLKDGGEEIVRREILASEICRCFDVPQVRYTEGCYQDQIVSESDIITSKERSIVSWAAFGIFAVNHDLDPVSACAELDPKTYYGMNILDYLTGNTDRHPENWGLWVDNRTNEPISLYPVMDFNQCFLAYDTIDGAGCLTASERMTQREAAVIAVRKIGLPQICEFDLTKFGDRKAEAEMFQKRLAELKKICNIG